ncbi:MAG: hypothetical protein RMN51_02490 [Verrucomicrobiota bacterium]|nr:hypothetical protein [Limisphaera sp.]MDW8380965.1 hypothetical protein [Verrucomicrobiota bacterium]
MAEPQEPNTELEKVRHWLVSCGCPPARSLEMAQHLIRRADQLARQHNRPRHEALEHLLRLIAQARSWQGGGAPSNRGTL